MRTNKQGNIVVSNFWGGKEFCSLIQISLVSDGIKWQKKLWWTILYTEYEWDCERKTRLVQGAVWQID